MTNANALPIQERRLQERLRDQQFDKGQYYPFEHWFLAEAADHIDALEKALRRLVTAEEDGCLCSEMEMATAIDEARAALGEGE